MTLLHTASVTAMRVRRWQARRESMDVNSCNSSMYFIQQYICTVRL